MTPTQVQNHSLSLVALPQVPSLQPVKVNPHPSVCDTTAQLCVIGKLAKGALNPTARVSDKGAK